MIRAEPPGSLLLDVGVGDVVAVGQAGQLEIIERDGTMVTMQWRRSAVLPPVTRRLGLGYGMPLEGEHARIRVEKRRGSRVRIRVVADAAVRIRMRPQAEPA